MTDEPYILFLRPQLPSTLLRVFEIIKGSVAEVNLQFSPTGLEVRETCGSHSSALQILLPSTGFKHFECPIATVVVVTSSDLYNALKSLPATNEVSMYITKDDPWKVVFEICDPIRNHRILHDITRIERLTRVDTVFPVVDPTQCHYLDSQGLHTVARYIENSKSLSVEVYSTETMIIFKRPGLLTTGIYPFEKSSVPLALPERPAGRRGAAPKPPPNPPRKRGRRPKPKPVVVEPTIKKRRGRKPKNPKPELVPPTQVIKLEQQEPTLSQETLALISEPVVVPSIGSVLPDAILLPIESRSQSLPVVESGTTCCISSEAVSYSDTATPTTTPNQNGGTKRVLSAEPEDCSELKRLKAESPTIRTEIPPPDVSILSTVSTVGSIPALDEIAEKVKKELASKSTNDYRLKIKREMSAPGVIHASFIAADIIRADRGNVLSHNVSLHLTKSFLILSYDIDSVGKLQYVIIPSKVEETDKSVSGINIGFEETLVMKETQFRTEVLHSDSYDKFTS